MAIRLKRSSNMKTRVVQIFAILFAIYIVVFASVFGLSPYIIKTQVKTALVPYKLRVAEESHIQFNPFTGSLTVRDFVFLNEEDSAVLKIAEARIDINLIALMSKRVAFDVLAINDVEVTVVRDHEQMSIIGVPLPQNNQKTDEKSKEITQSANWELALNEHEITNILVNYLDNGKYHPVMISKTNISDTVATLETQRVTVNSLLKLNSANLNVAFNVDLDKAVGVVDFAIAIADLDLAKFGYLLQEHGDLASANLDSTIRGTALVTQKGIDIPFNQLDLDLSNLSFQYSGEDISLARFFVSSDDLTVSVKDNEPNLEASLSTSLTNFSIVQRDTEHLIIGFSEASSNSIQAQFVDNDIALGFDDFAVSDIALSDIYYSDKSKENSELATLNRLVITDTKITPNFISLGKVLLDTLNANLMINEQREILNLVNVGNEKEASSDVVSKADSSVVTEESKQGATEKARALVDFKVDAIEVSRASQISVYDESVMPAFEQSIVFNVVKLTRLNSRDKDILASLLLDADIGKHANITMNADIQPFLPKLNLNTKTKLTEFSLPRVSSYMGKSLGLEFLSGQLDSDITLKVVDNILDGDAVINLRGLELAGTSHEKGNLVEETGMVPLNVALNMLKDADDNVELNIPLSGDVNSPSFGIQSFVGLVTKKAIMSATESYLMQTFVPYSNIVSVAKIAGEFMLKVTIDDLIYEPSQLVVSDKQTQFVSDLVALMAEYPKKQLKVCVVSVPEDIGIKNSLGKEEQAELVKFAGERAQLFKEELVTNYQVASARLLLCKPKIETQENASPRIEFRF